MKQAITPEPVLQCRLVTILNSKYKVSRTINEVVSYVQASHQKTLDDVKKRDLRKKSDIFLEPRF